MLINIVQWEGQPPTTKNYLAQSVSSAEVRNRGLWSEVTGFSLNKPTLFLSNLLTSCPPLSLLSAAAAIILSPRPEKGTPENIVSSRFHSVMDLSVWLLCASMCLTSLGLSFPRLCIRLHGGPGTVL